MIKSDQANQDQDESLEPAYLLAHDPRPLQVLAQLLRRDAKDEQLR
jgi:hypothetical protein